MGKSSARTDVAANPLDLIKGARVIPSDLNLGKTYGDARKEYEMVLKIRN